MPIPQPEASESRSEFIGRCMEILAEDHPDPAQRAAICHATWNRQARKSALWLAPGVRVTKLKKPGFGTVKQVDPARREIEFIASQQIVDRDGDLTITAGIRTENCRTLIRAHKPDDTLARIDAFQKPSINGVPSLVGRATFLPAGVSAVADQAFAEAQHGTLLGVSIGFLPLEWDGPTLPGQTGRTFTKVDLVEVSLTAVPSCPTCVVTAKCTGTHDETLIVTRETADAVRRASEPETLVVRDRDGHILSKSEIAGVIRDTVEKQVREAKRLAVMAATGYLGD